MLKIPEYFEEVSKILKTHFVSVGYRPRTQITNAKILLKNCFAGTRKEANKISLASSAWDRGLFVFLHVMME